MLKTLSLILITALVQLCYSQPRCFVVGPALNIGKTTVQNHSFTRTVEYDDLGTPMTNFSETGNVKLSNLSAGVMMDIYTKHARIAMDLMYPFKESTGNFFNFNLAFGGYIGGKIGILAGLSYYANKKLLPAESPSLNHQYWQLTDDYTNDGSFYNNGNILSQGGLNLLLTYALHESFVIRADYGFYAGSITNRKTNEPENYDWDITHNRKLEIGAAWQISDILGIALRFQTWKTAGEYKAEIPYMVNGNEQQATIQLMPERTFLSNNFTFCLMIPLGNATATGGSISVN